MMVFFNNDSNIKHNRLSIGTDYIKRTLGFPMFNIILGHEEN